MIRGFIFDMDGLLVDTESIHVLAFEEFMRRKGLCPPPGYAQNLVGFSIRHNIERMQRELGLPGDTAAMVDERNALYLDMLTRVPLDPLPGVAEAFALAEKRALKKAVCSSSDRDQLDVVLPRVLATLGKARPEVFFDVTLSGNDVTPVKPAPDLYLACARRMDLAPEECLAFEDSPAGAASAAAARVNLIVVPNRFVAPGTVWPTPLVFKSLSDIFANGTIVITADGISVNVSGVS